MAFLSCQCRSAALGRGVTFRAVIPDGISETTNTPTLYLLHGLGDDGSAWERYTSVCRYAEDRGLAVIMPDGAASFYTDTVGGERYFSFVADELVPLTRSMFRISQDREKTFAAGNSMGGYGAVKCALSRPDLFGAALTLSGALDIVSMVQKLDWMQELSLRNWGPDCHRTVENSSSDLFFLANRLLKDGSLPLPRIYQICGTEDFLYGENQVFRRYMQEVAVPAGMEYQYLESDGEHTWAFWDRWLPQGMDLLLKR